MALGIVEIADVVVPEVFTPYIQQLTEEKARIIQSGVAGRAPILDLSMAGGGQTYNVPSFADLDADDTNGPDRISGTVPSNLTDTTNSTAGVIAPEPQGIATATEVAVRLDRNNSWSSMDLNAALAGADPMSAIADRVSYYWTRRLQRAFVETMVGVFADNTANDSGDYSNDITGAFAEGVTTFSAEAAIDALDTAGDSSTMFTTVMMHSVVYNRAKKNNLIDVIKDSENNVQFEMFQGLRVVVDDGMPVATQDYDTWFFGAGAIQMGMASQKNGTEVDRLPGGGNGAGQEVLYNRPSWTIHPVGHAYTGAVTTGGPSNATLALAASWDRVYSERKQIAVARLVTTEA